MQRKGVPMRKNCSTMKIRREEIPRLHQCDSVETTLTEVTFYKLKTLMKSL